MEMNLDDLLNIPDPANPSLSSKLNSKSTVAADVVIDGPSIQRSASRSALTTGRKGDVVIDNDHSSANASDSLGSRPPSVPIGSARAAAISLKNSASAASVTSATADTPSKADVEQKRRKYSDGPAAFDIDKLANSMKVLDEADQSLPTHTKSNTALGSGPVSSSALDPPNASGLSPKASAAAMDTAETNKEGLSKPAGQTSLAAEDTAQSAQGTPTKPLETSASDGTTKSDQADTSASGKRVPKFRRKSGAGEDFTPTLGKGAEGPKDPDGIDKVVEIKVEIIDSDQLSPRAEAVVRTKKDNKIVLAMLNVKFRYQHDHVRKVSSYQVLGLKLHGFSSDLLQNRFEPYLKLSFGTNKWTCVTSSVKSTGQVAEWKFDAEHGFFDKMFKVSDEDLAVEANSFFTAVVKKKNPKGNEDFESGAGSILFTHALFKDAPSTN